ncbi:hypothetical protein D5086_029103, partial [Populus alba]
VLLEEGDGIKGRELGEKSNDTRGSFLSEGVHITVLQQSSSSHQGVGRWGEGEKAFPLKKRRGSFERRSNEEMIMDRNKKMKTKMKTNMNTCVQQNGDNEEDEKETKEGVGSNVKTKPKGGVLLEGSRCSHVNDDKEKPLVISKRKMKLGLVKARSMSSLLGQANNAVGVAENNG